MNTLSISGYVASEPKKAKRTPLPGMEVWHFRLAVRCPYKRKDKKTGEIVYDSMFFYCEYNNYDLEHNHVMDYVKKGGYIGINGRLQTYKYGKNENVKIQVFLFEFFSADIVEEMDKLKQYMPKDESGKLCPEMIDFAPAPYGEMPL